MMVAVRVVTSTVNGPDTVSRVVASMGTSSSFWAVTQMVREVPGVSGLTSSALRLTGGTTRTAAAKLIGVSLTMARTRVTSGDVMPGRGLVWLPAVPLTGHVHEPWWPSAMVRWA